jgi:hypothetical protein
MNKTRKFSPEVRERAVRMVQEQRGQYPSLWSAVESIAPKIGIAWPLRGACMTRKSKKGADTPEVRFDPKLMEALVPGPLTPAEANALIHGFKKALFERALRAELTHHLGYGKDEARPAGQTNHRNGTSAKTVVTDTGVVAVEVPCDRDGSFEPLLIGKHERRFTGFDDKIIALYARGMTVREIKAHLQPGGTALTEPAKHGQPTGTTLTATRSR